jgi:hypothetical protein
MNAPDKQPKLKEYPRHIKAHGSIFGVLCASLVLNLTHFTLSANTDSKKGAH